MRKTCNINSQSTYITVYMNKCRHVQKVLYQMSISDKVIIRISTWKTAQGLMSGYFTGQHKWINIFFTILLIIMHFSNLIQISPTENRRGTDRLDQRCNQPTNNQLSYTREQLVQIRQHIRHGNLFGLPSGSITNI